MLNLASNTRKNRSAASTSMGYEDGLVVDEIALRHIMSFDGQCFPGGQLFKHFHAMIPVPGKNSKQGIPTHHAIGFSHPALLSFMRHQGNSPLIYDF